MPVVTHKALPGDTDLKADLSKPYSSKKGFVMASNLVSDEASTWQKIKGVADLGGFGFEFFDAISKQPHEGEQPLPSIRRDMKLDVLNNFSPLIIQTATCPQSKPDLS